jgi:oxalate decarboxylase
MREERPDVTRRKFLGVGSAALALGGFLGIAAAQESKPRSSDHQSPNETEPPASADNSALEQMNPDSVWPPNTDNGSLSPFKYPFAFSRKRQDGPFLQ